MSPGQHKHQVPGLVVGLVLVDVVDFLPLSQPAVAAVLPQLSVPEHFATPLAISATSTPVGADARESPPSAPPHPPSKASNHWSVLLPCWCHQIWPPIHLPSCCLSLVPATRNGILTYKSGPKLWCCVHFDIEMCGVHFFDISTSKSAPCGVLHILTSKCASRHNGVYFSDLATSKYALKLRCFVHFDFEMCFAPQRRALFRHRNF